VLVMPAFHSASISTKMLQELGGCDGDRSADGRARQAVQIVPLGAQGHDIVNMAALAAFNVGG
jgi:malate dehydrogenase (oxaloacetate-decarboxylating)(NADP+)